MRATRGQKFFIVGGAGFIGSHFTDHLMGEGGAAAVTLYDNFSSGREWHYAHHAKDARLRVVRGEVEDTEALVAAMDGHDVVIHLASNPDIARAAREPSIDFTQGTVLSASVVEAMRRTSARRILYASGSGVYGDLGTLEAAEDHGPMLPVSTYGASKLAGENLIGSYAYMFGLSGCAFRFGNVVGPRQTHGVGFDFARRLLDAQRDSERSGAPIVLKILGDGKQSKSYVHVSDIVRAVLAAHEGTKKDFEPYNVATGDYITVAEIARMVVEVLGVDPDRTEFEFSGTDRGWKGDVPVMRLNTERVRSLGWKNAMSTREAMRASLDSMLEEVRSGKLT